MKNIKMEILQFLKEGIPGSWLTKLLLTTIGPVVSALAVWGDLLRGKIFGSTTPEILSQTILALIVLLLWALSLLVILVILYKREYDKFNFNDKELKGLSRQTVEILRMIAANEDPFETLITAIIDEKFISEACNISPQETKFHLDQLEKADCIVNHVIGISGITSKGRAFLLKQRLLP